MTRKTCREKPRGHHALKVGVEVDWFPERQKRGNQRRPMQAMGTPRVQRPGRKRRGEEEQKHPEIPSGRLRCKRGPWIGRRSYPSSLCEVSHCVPAVLAWSIQNSDSSPLVACMLKK